jgi:hypothetical protein
MHLRSVRRLMVLGGRLAALLVVLAIVTAGPGAGPGEHWSALENAVSTGGCC